VLEEVSDEEDCEKEGQAQRSTAGPNSIENQDSDLLMMSRFDMMRNVDGDGSKESETFKSLYQKNRIPTKLLTDEDLKDFEQEQGLITHEDI
jgi:hypothetical protein